MPPRPPLSRREREIMEVIFRRGEGTAVQVRESLVDPPGYSAVRATLAILEGKGHLRHEVRGNRYVYLPTVSRERAKRSALREMLQTFFAGSPKDAVVALLDQAGDGMSERDLEEIQRLIADARKAEGRKRGK